MRRTRGLREPKRERRFGVPHRFRGGPPANELVGAFAIVAGPGARYKGEEAG